MPTKGGGSLSARQGSCPQQGISPSAIQGSLSLLSFSAIVSNPPFSTLLQCLRVCKLHFPIGFNKRRHWRESRRQKEGERGPLSLPPTPLSTCDSKCIGGPVLWWPEPDIKTPPPSHSAVPQPAARVPLSTPGSTNTASPGGWEAPTAVMIPGSLSGHPLRCHPSSTRVTDFQC